MTDPHPDALHSWGRIKTAVLTTQQLARIFKTGRNSMARLLSQMDGAERLGRGMWRVELRQMPDAYLAELGLLTVD